MSTIGKSVAQKRPVLNRAEKSDHVLGELARIFRTSAENIRSRRFKFQLK